MCPCCVLCRTRTALIHKTTIRSVISVKREKLILIKNPPTVDRCRLLGASCTCTSNDPGFVLEAAYLHVCCTCERYYAIQPTNQRNTPQYPCVCSSSKLTIASSTPHIQNQNGPCWSLWLRLTFPPHPRMCRLGVPGIKLFVLKLHFSP